MVSQYLVRLFYFFLIRYLAKRMVRLRIFKCKSQFLCNKIHNVGMGFS